jgi:hypothetical protein
MPRPKKSSDPEKKKRPLTTIELDEDILAAFRIAVATKHKGHIHGMMRLEYNNALDTWTKVMNGESQVINAKKETRAPIFERKQHDTDADH